MKICGITTPEDGLMASDAGADAIGLVFWPESPRAVGIEAAREIARELPPLVTRVGVFRGCLARVHGGGGGGPSVSTSSNSTVTSRSRRSTSCLGGHSWRCVSGRRFDEGFAAEAAQRGAGILLDSRVPGSYGGTGVTFDWGVARRLREKVSHLVVAGGLRPNNVAAAIRDVGPDAIDVSTGVESAPGKKDRAKLASLFAAVEAAQPAVAR